VGVISNRLKNSKGDWEEVFPVTTFDAVRESADPASDNLTTTLGKKGDLISINNLQAVIDTKASQEEYESLSDKYDEIDRKVKSSLFWIKIGMAGAGLALLTDIVYFSMKAFGL